VRSCCRAPCEGGGKNENEIFRPPFFFNLLLSPSHAPPSPSLSLSHTHPHTHTTQLRVANTYAATSEHYVRAQGNLSFSELLATAEEAFTRRAALTERLLFAGPAMAPTLNARAALAAGGGGAAAAAAAAAARDAVEGLLLWRDPPAIRVGDVVAFTAPPGTRPGYEAAYGLQGGTVVGGGGGPAAAAAAAAPSPGTTAPPPPTLVRRVAALGGETLVDGDGPGAGTLAIPAGHAWLLADAAELLPPAAAPDSRAFGPVPLSAVLGRVIYSAASPADHGPVLSSSPASASDDAEVVAAELCVDDLAPPRATPA